MKLVLDFCVIILYNKYKDKERKAKRLKVKRYDVRFRISWSRICRSFI